MVKNVQSYKKHLESNVDPLVFEDIGKENFFIELQIRIYLQLINDLVYGYVQHDHIQPLLKRVESNITSLEKVIRPSAKYKSVLRFFFLSVLLT